jgi:hypothetical protein
MKGIVSRNAGSMALPVLSRSVSYMFILAPLLACHVPIWPRLSPRMTKQRLGLSPPMAQRPIQCLFERNPDLSPVISLVYGGGAANFVLSARKAVAARSSTGEVEGSPAAGKGAELATLSTLLIEETEVWRGWLEMATGRLERNP